MEGEQETIPPTSNQVESSIDTSLPIVQDFEGIPAPRLNSHSSADEGMPTYVSGQIENPTVVTAPGVEVLEEKVAKFSTEQSTMDSGPVAKTARQESISSQTAATETAESKVDIARQASAPASAIRGAEIKAENAVTPAAPQVDAPVIDRFHPGNDPLPARPEIAADVKTDEVQTDKVESADFVSQIKTQVNQNIGTEQVEQTAQLQQSETMNVKAHEAEKAIPQASVQTEIKLPLSRAETNNETFVGQTKNSEEKTASQSNVSGNNESYQVQTSEPIRQGSQQVSISNTGIDQEVKEVVIQPVTESVEASFAHDLSETSSSNAEKFSEDSVKAQSIEINNHSTIPTVTNVSANKPETPITHRVDNPDGLSTDSSRTTSEVNSAKMKAGQETIDDQVDVTVTRDRFSLPTQEGIVAPETSTAKNIGPEQFASQPDIQARTGETQQAQAISETLVTKEVKNSEEVVNQVKPVEQQTTKTSAMSHETLTEENVSKSGASENIVISSDTNTGSSTVIKEESIPLSSTQFNVPASNFAEPMKDVRIVNESKQTSSQTNAVPDVVQPRVDFNNSSKDIPVIETTDHLNSANSTETTWELEVNSSRMQAVEGTNENFGLQQPTSTRPSIPQNQPIAINLISGTKPELAEVRPNIPLTQEATPILNESVNDTVEGTPHAEDEASIVESKPVELQTSANPQAKTVPLPEQIFISDVDGVDQPVQTDELFVQNGRTDVDVKPENHDGVAESETVAPRVATDKSFVENPQGKVDISTTEKSSQSIEPNHSQENKTQVSAVIEEAVVDLYNSTIDEANAPANTEPVGIALSSPIAELETNTDILSLDNFQSTDTVSEMADDFPVADVSADLVKGKAQTATNQKDIVTERPVSRTMQAQIDVNRQPVTGSKINPLHLDVTTSSNEISQANTVIASNESEPNTRQIETETEPEQISFNTNSTLPQDEPNNASVESQRPIQSPAIAKETVTDSQLDEKINNSTVHQETMKESLLQPEDRVQAPQSTDNHREANSESLSVGPQVSSAEFVETLPLNFDHPVEAVIADQTNIHDVKTKNPAPQPVEQRDISEDLKPNVQSVTSKAETVQTRNVESPVNVNTAETQTAQQGTNPAEKEIFKSDAGVVKSTDGAMFVEASENSNNSNSRTIFVNEPNNTVSQESLSTINDTEAFVSSQPGISIKAEDTKSTVKNKPTVVKDEELLPVEKKSRQDQTFEAAPTTTGPVKETLNAGYNGKAPIDQVNAQAAEVAQQVIHQMSIKIKNGPTSMHLQLNPKELGNIDVEMVSTAQGVRVTFFTEQASTGKLLETQLSQLRETLVDAGVQLSGLNISQHGPSEQKGGFFSQDKNFTQYFQGDTARSEPNIIETLLAEHNTGKSGEVDYRI